MSCNLRSFRLLASHASSLLPTFSNLNLALCQSGSATIFCACVKSCSTLSLQCAWKHSFIYLAPFGSFFSSLIFSPRLRLQKAIDELSPRLHFEGTFGTFACALPLVVCRVSLVASQRWWVIEYGNVRVSLCLCGFYVISYEQTTQSIHLKHSQPLSICLSCPHFVSFQRRCAGS